MNGEKRARNIAAPVNRIINLLDVGRELALQFRHPSAGRSGYNYLEVGQAWLQRADELGGDIHFANADRVNPEHVPIGHRLFDFGTETPEALAKAA